MGPERNPRELRTTRKGTPKRDTDTPLVLGGHGHAHPGGGGGNDAQRGDAPQEADARRGNLLHKEKTEPERASLVRQVPLVSRCQTITNSSAQ